jgi:hypothetical protein
VIRFGKFGIIVQYVDQFAVLFGERFIKAMEA